VSAAPPERVQLDDGVVVRWVTVADAEAIARAVGESLEHLKPWMPWADARSADVVFQRSRLREQIRQRSRREEWQYGMFANRSAFVGSIGLMTRRGPGTIEIGYWLHVDAVNRGLATNAARALTAAAFAMDDIETTIIVCDEANLRSAAIPQRLGYTLDRTDARAPEAPGETGRMQIWIADKTSFAAEPTTA
jgi:RimJ/RimL family protein N-acetyltransferase